MSMQISDRQMLALIGIGGAALYVALRHDWKQQTMTDARVTSETNYVSSEVHNLRNRLNPLLRAYGYGLPDDYELPYDYQLTETEME